MPITIEAKLPMSPCRKANFVLILGFIGEISNDNNIICWSSLIPAMEGKHLLVLIEMIDLRELSAESTSLASLIEP